MPSTSPRGGVVIRQRQSSVTTDTQTPVRSSGAAARAEPGAGATPCWAAAGPASAIQSTAIASPANRARHHHLPPSMKLRPDFATGPGPSHGFFRSAYTASRKRSVVQGPVVLPYTGS